MNRSSNLNSSVVAAAIVLGGLVAIAVGQTDSASVVNTKHNLTATGPGTIKTGAGGEPCLFCHTPHAASPKAPLWNRKDSGAYYQTYESSTLQADVGQPTGSSRLCLSCHDGTIALTDTYNPNVRPSGGAIFISATDRGYIGTDLSDDHPISFVYDGALATRQGELRHPASLPRQLPLDENNQLQCTTCHDPHNNARGKFLRLDNTASKLCITCHEIQDWSTSAHATATASLSSSQRDAWDNLDVNTVSLAGCESCHRPHAAKGRQRLLRHEAEEANCLNCHDGSVASTDIAAVMQRVSAHDAGRTTGVHDPTEDVASMREHVECSDCHAPHSINAAGRTASAPAIKPSMYGVSGVTRTGTTVDPARYEYEVCYRCHGTRNFAKPVVTRVLGDDDIAEEFNPNNQSYHPVETFGRNSRVPSLTQEFDTKSMLYCTDCHSSDRDAAGPHGSNHSPLLTDRYEVRDFTAESPAAYALCYRCHERTSILNDESFAEHKLHIVDDKTSCGTCHDPHGVAKQAHLINFDTNVVEPSTTTGRGPTFTDMGDRRGSCTLNCHNREHVDESY